MKTDPINSITNFSKTAFKGYKVSYAHDTSHFEAALKTGRRSEKTLNSYHTEPKHVLYYADPREDVSDDIKQSVDYVFYDDEPAFPAMSDVEKLYKEPNSRSDVENMGSRIGKFKDYFYRLEMVDRGYIGEYQRKLWNNIDVEDSKEKSDYYIAQKDEAQYNQETAGNCENIFNASKDALNRRNQLAADIESIKAEIASLEQEIPKADNELKQREGLKNIIDARIASLGQQKKIFDDADKNLATISAATLTGIAATTAYANYNEQHLGEYERLRSLSKPNSVRPYQQMAEQLEQSKGTVKHEKSVISEQKRLIQLAINQYNMHSQANNGVIEGLKKYAGELPLRISSLRVKLEQTSKLLDDAQKALVPMFNNFKDYFVSRGVKMIH